MSVSDSKKKFVKRYTTGERRYHRFIEEVLGVELTEAQEQIITAVVENRQVAVYGANGYGKSHTLACLNVAFLYCNRNATALATSGSYSQLTDALFRPMESLINEANQRVPFIGGSTVQNPPRVKFENRPEQFFKAVSTTDPGALEGRHNDHVLVSIEESDKEGISADVIDSARSSITDANDTIICIGNPPRTESNSFYELIDSDNWEVLQFSSFDSRNAQIDAGVVDEDKGRIPGLVDLETIRADWKEWHEQPWPGFEEAQNHSQFDGLDMRWYRRRLGMVPAEDAQAVRPFKISAVLGAEERWESPATVDDVQFDAYAMDVARGGGDRSVIAGVNGNRFQILADVESPGHLDVNRQLVRDNISDYHTPLVIDAIGEGSGLADDLSSYNTYRFKSGENALESDAYYDKRTEALGNFGSWLNNGGMVKPGTDAGQEFREAARNIELEEKSTRGSSSFKATSKDELKKSHSIGRSPDLLDAVSMAVWGMRHLNSSTGLGAPGWGGVTENTRNADSIW